MARSALSGYVDISECDSLGEHPLMKRFIKGVFEQRPSLPKYAFTWDVDVVLMYLENLYPHDKLTLKELTYKLATLLAILTSQRCQTLHSLSLAMMKMFENKCVFHVDVLLKQSKYGKHLDPIELFAFPSNRKLCIVDVLKEYLSRTKPLRGPESKLFISYTKPHQCVSKDTLARWIKDTLNRAGVDTSLFGAHSTRSASASAAVSRGVPLVTIMKAAGWSAESTFAKFYKKAPTVNLGQTLLDSYMSKI